MGLLFTMLSCSDDTKTNTPAFQGKLNDVPWRANDARASINEDGGMTITAYTENEIFIINTNSTDPGTYVLGTTNLNNFASYKITVDGFDSYYDTYVMPGPAYKVAVNQAGTGYSDATILQTSGGSGSGLRVAINTNTAGAITKASVTARGINYRAGDIVNVLGGDGNATFRVLNVQQSNGEVVIDKFENGTFTGSFKVNASDGLEGNVTLSEGVFYKVPILQ